MKSKYLIFLIILMGLFLIVSCAKDVPVEEDEILDEEIEEEVEEVEEPIVEEEEIPEVETTEEVLEEESDVVCGEEVYLYFEQSIEYAGKLITLQSVASDAIVLNVDGEYESLALAEIKDFDGVVVELNTIFERTEETEESVTLTIECEEEETILYFTDSFGNAVACDETAGIQLGDTIYYEDKAIYLEEFTSSEANFQIDGFPRAFRIGDTHTVNTIEMTLESIFTRADPSESSVGFKISC